MADDVKLANPAVLGLTCFGMTTVLLNLHNAGLFKMDAPILAMGLFLGGAVQIIAGALEFKSIYPRTANMFLKWEITPAEAESLARWDFLILDMERYVQVFER